MPDTGELLRALERTLAELAEFTAQLREADHEEGTEHG